MTFSAAYFALQSANVLLASLGLLQIGFLLNLVSPAGIFSNFVRELGRDGSADGRTETPLREEP